MDWLSDNAWVAWLSVAAVLAGLEMFSMDLVLLMLAAGAVVGAIAALVGLGVAPQVLLAAGAAVAMLVLVRPSVLSRLRTGPELQLGHGKLVGHEAVVTQEITAHDHGRVKLAGEIWSAAPYSEFDTIAVGETVEVFEIRGATAYVHPIHRPES